MRDNKRSSTATPLVVTAIVLLLPLLYFLSLGPLAWLQVNGYVREGQFVEAYCWPGNQAIDRSRWFRGVLARYVLWCAGLPKED